MKDGRSEGRSCRRHGHTVGQPGHWDSEDHTQRKGWPQAGHVFRVALSRRVCFGGSIKDSKPDVEHMLGRTSGGQVGSGKSQRERGIKVITFFSSVYGIVLYFSCFPTMTCTEHYYPIIQIEDPRHSQTSS